MNHKETDGMHKSSDKGIQAIDYKGLEIIAKAIAKVPDEEIGNHHIDGYIEMIGGQFSELAEEDARAILMQARNIIKAETLEQVLFEMDKAEELCNRINCDEEMKNWFLKLVLKKREKFARILSTKNKINFQPKTTIKEILGNMSGKQKQDELPDCVEENVLKGLFINCRLIRIDIIKKLKQSNTWKIIMNTVFENNSGEFTYHVSPIFELKEDASSHVEKDAIIISTNEKRNDVEITEIDENLIAAAISRPITSFTEITKDEVLEIIKRSINSSKILDQVKAKLNELFNDSEFATNPEGVNRFEIKRLSKVTNFTDDKKNESIRILGKTISISPMPPIGGPVLMGSKVIKEDFPL